MRNCGEILENEIHRKKVKRVDLCKFVGFTPQNLSKLLRKDSIDAGLLERFCQYLNLDPADFFDYRPEYASSGMKVGDITQSIGIGATTEAFYQSEKDLLLQLLAEKDSRIKNLEGTVRLLNFLLTKVGFDMGVNPGQVTDK